MTENPGLPGQAPDNDTLAAMASAQIMRRIETLQLAPGATVTERELATDLDVGKAPIREALLRLSGTGLVTPRTGSGYVISPITLRQARSLFELWRALERASLEGLGGRALAAFEALSPAKLRELMAAQGTDYDVFDAHMMFHAVILMTSGNTPMMRAFPNFEINRLLRFTSSLGADVSCSDAVHDELWAAMLAQQVDVAWRLAQDHLADLETRVLNALMKADQVQEINLAGGS